jgi:hypothetical protein
MVHPIGRPPVGICHQRNALNTGTGRRPPPHSRSGTSQQMSALVSVRAAIVDAEEDERKTHD